MSPRLHIAVEYAVIWVAITLALMWPALINGGPIWFADSLAYLNGPRSALEALAAGPVAGGGFGEPAAVAAGAPEPYAGRSIYYGFALYLLVFGLDLWAAPAVQAGLFAVVLIVALRPFMAGRTEGALFVGFWVAALTAAPFFAVLLMPDFLAGLMILSAIRLLAVPERPGRMATVLFWAVTALAALSHTGHVLILIGLVLLAPAIFRMFGQAFSWRLVRPLALAIFVAGVGSALFTAVVVETYGKPPLRPPFLSARVIADGPGYAHLVDSCDTRGYALCDYVDRLPRSANVILWNKDPETGIWGAADTATRRAISDQDLRFASDVLRAHPLGQIRAGLARLAEQLRWFGLESLPYPLSLKQSLASWWTGPEGASIRATRFYRGTFALDAADLLYKMVVLLSAGHLAWLAATRRARRDRLTAPTPGFALFAGLVILGLVLNAAIYGILSDPVPRYQARVIWLLPMLSAMLLWQEIAPGIDGTKHRRSMPPAE